MTLGATFAAMMMTITPDLSTTDARLAALGAPAALHVRAPCLPDGLGIAHGMADPVSGIALDVATPLRVASITKTFTAATALRLWEGGQLDIEQPIRHLIAPAYAAMLQQAGYDLDAITVRHLLNHTAGIYDHAADSRYHRMWIERPDHRWTRHEQVALSVGWSGPTHAPGTHFAYSDTGYILLGDIIERVTGLPLAQAARDELGLDTFGLEATWWEVAEPAPPSARQPAAQMWQGHDTRTMHGSLDTYGGGGLMMSARDMTAFFERLLQGAVFRNPQTLQEMLRASSHEGGDLYRLGIMALHDADGRGNTAYYHAGFWGTVVYAIPETGVAVSGVTTEQSSYRALNGIVQDTLKTLRCPAD